MNAYLMEEITGPEVIFRATEKPPRGPAFNKGLAEKYQDLQIWSITGGQVEFRLVTREGIVVARRKIVRHNN